MKKTEIIEKVMTPILDKGFKVFFVGGCVRDFFLGKEPHDFDLTTNALPDDLHKIFKRFSNVSNNSEKYGITIPLIDMDDGSTEEFEIATFRRDTSPGRKPTVSLNASMEEDALRRDFTINAMYQDIKGNVFDPTNHGLIDINHGILRFCGNANERITEDPLRVLRLIRFVSKLGFDFVEE